MALKENDLSELNAAIEAYAHYEIYGDTQKAFIHGVNEALERKVTPTDAIQYSDAAQALASGFAMTEAARRDLGKI